MSWNGASRGDLPATTAWVRGGLIAALFLTVAVALPCGALAFLAGDAGLSEESRLWKFLARFHAVLLHLPIGFVGIAVVLELWSILRPNAERARVTTFVLVVTASTASVVATLGLMLASEGGFDETTLVRHKWLGLSFVGLSIVAAGTNVLHRRFPRSPRLRRGYRGALAAAALALVATGHYGGNLTHGSQYLVEYAPELLRSLSGDEPAASAEGARGGRGLYLDVVEPIFRAKCYRCHGPEKQKGDFRLDDPETALAGGESELPAIVAGEPLRSNLVRLILLPEDDRDAMPPRGKERLTPEETLAIVHWIRAGASFSGDEPADRGEPADEAEPVPEAEPAGDDEAATGSPALASGSGSAGGEVDFVRDVKPTLERSCLPCHDRKKRKGRLGLFDLEAILKGGKDLGPAVVRGSAATSPLYARISIPPAADEDEELMPPPDEGGPLDEPQIALIGRWIDAGAPWPEGMELAAVEE